MPENSLQIKRIHHIELWVGNARQASYFYRKGFGFSQPLTRDSRRESAGFTSYVLRAQGRRRTSCRATPLDPEHPAYDHIRKHGDGVRDIAFHVADA